MVKSRSVVLSTRRKLGHGVAFYKILTWELIASQRSTIYQTKSNFVALPPLTKLSVKFKRNRLPNVQDITFFSIRPPPNFCLINLFMSSLSPAALSLLATISMYLLMTSFLLNLIYVCQINKFSRRNFHFNYPLLQD